MRDEMRLGVFCAAVAFASGSVASAGMMPTAPALSIEVLLNDQSVFEMTPQGMPGGSGQFVYNGMESTDDWVLDWDISADPDPFVMAGLAFTNNTGSTQTVSLITILPISPAVMGSSLIGGSVQGGITADGDGGTLAAIDAMSPIYQAIVDDALVGAPAELFVGSSVTVGPSQSGNVASPEDFGTPIPSAPGPAALVNIGLRYDFTLTPGDQASFTGTFVLLPAPGGAMALCGLGVFVARRRR